MGHKDPAAGALAALLHGLGRPLGLRDEHWQRALNPFPGTRLIPARARDGILYACTAVGSV
jgi:hypothetical protein